MALVEQLPRWSVADVHDSFDARSFIDELERLSADVDRLVSLFDERGIRGVEPRPVTADDGMAADEALRAYNATLDLLDVLQAYVSTTVTTDSRNERAQALLSQIADHGARLRPLRARLAQWVAGLGLEGLIEVSNEAAEHHGPLARLEARSHHQMNEAEEHLYAELATTGSGAWARLQADVTSHLTAQVVLADGVHEMPMPAVRGLAVDADEAVRRAGYEAELRAWPTIATPVASALNAIKGETNAVDRRRRWPSPLAASLFENSVSRDTFDAMHGAITDALPDFRRWMKVKARIHAAAGAETSGLAWWNLVAPLPSVDVELSWDDGIDIVRSAFSGFSSQLGGLVDRALAERWIDAPPTAGKVGGAFCMPFIGDRSLVLLNWSGSVDSAQTTAHELGHAYHNVTLAGRTALQRDLPMALAETASIFCETLVVEAGLGELDGLDRLALLNTDLTGANQVIVDIRSRFLFETELFVRRQKRTLGVHELDEMMGQAQAEAYGDGIDQETAHPHMWLLKPHYYGAHFYNWQYTYGLLFGLGLFARYREDPDQFRSGYDDLLSRAGMDDAEELARTFDLDVGDQAFWVSSLDVLRGRINEYENLATELGLI